MQAPAPRPPAGRPWTHREFFALLGSLGRLRIICRCGPSTFEAICRLGPHGFARGHMNAITDAYHWHLRTAGFGHVRSHEAVHERSGRRVLYFELRESADREPFLLVYLYRPPREEFDARAEEHFLAAHAELGGGAALTSRDDEGTP
jgi:hypothetical protein